MNLGYFISADTGMLASQASIEFDRGRQGKSIGYRAVSEFAVLVEETCRRNDPTINSVLYEVITALGIRLETLDDLRAYISSVANKMKNAMSTSSEDLASMRDFSSQLTRQICSRRLSNRAANQFKRYCFAA